MRFLKKNNLYHLVCLVFFTSIGYFKEPISPHLFISEQNTNLFYSFNNNHLSLYEILQSQTYNKIWEYHFLENKTSELSSIMFEDITGNGQKELILILHAFGEQGEIYIFSTNKFIPTGKPDIYSFPSLKTGTKPTNAAMVNWDGDKDYEILVNLSSPERKIIIFDYNINKLLPIDQIGATFLGSTYGLIDLYVADVNLDEEEDIIIYNHNQEPSRHIIFSDSKEENKDLSTHKNIKKIIPLLDKEFFKDIGLNIKGELISLSDDKRIPTKDGEIIDIISSSDKHIITTTKNKLIQHLVPQLTQQNSIETTLPTQELICINNQKNSAVLCSHKEQRAVFLYDFFSSPKEISLQQQKNENGSPTAVENITKTKQDTLYVNAGNQITIDINQKYKIKSIETIQKPKTIQLDAQNLQFTWNTTAEDIGEHILEYDITYNTQTTLKTTDTPNNQLAINSIETTKDQNIKHLIYVNDPPKILIDNPQDTIKLPGTYQTNYSIADDFYVSKEALQTLKPSNLLIDSKTVYWEPTKKEAGKNTFSLYISDGLAQDTLQLEVFVDTTTTQVQYNQENLIATVNEEFIYQLKHQAGQNYKILNAPTNVWISKTGKIHWIPIITQIDNNSLEIEISSDVIKEKHKLDVFVNAPPIISYRPDKNEIILQNDSLIFQCQSFDMNTDPRLNWKLLTYSQDLNDRINLSKGGKLSIYSDSLLDNYQYTLHLSDNITEDQFTGRIYINDTPKIISTPPNYLSLGDTLKYKIIVADQNIEKPFNPMAPNEIIYALQDTPDDARLNQNTKEIIWIPQTQHIGNNTFSISVSDSLSTDLQHFSIFVNDATSIISIDSLSIAVGDTL